MKRSGVMRALGVLTVTVLLVVLGTGCTKYASEEDLQNLERQREAALTAETRVEQLRADKRELEALKAQKEAELQEALAEKAAVAERIAALEDADAEKMGINKDEAAKIAAGEQAEAEMEAPPVEGEGAGEMMEEGTGETMEDAGETMEEDAGATMEEGTEEMMEDAGETMDEGTGEAMEESAEEMTEEGTGEEE